MVFGPDVPKVLTAGAFIDAGCQSLENDALLLAVERYAEIMAERERANTAQVVKKKAREALKPVFKWTSFWRLEKDCILVR